MENTLLNHKSLINLIESINSQIDNITEEPQLLPEQTSNIAVLISSAVELYSDTNSFNALMDLVTNNLNEDSIKDYIKPMFYVNSKEDIDWNKVINLNEEADSRKQKLLTK